MTTRVRPVTDLRIPQVAIVGSARVNAAAQTVSGSGTVPCAQVAVAGAGHVTAAPVLGPRGSGALSLKTLRLVSNTVIKRSRGAGTVPTKKLALAGTATRSGPTAAAAVQIYDINGQPIGYGPSDDPGGVFLGRTDLANGDLWWPSTVPAGCTVTPLPGGSFIPSVASNVTPGVYSFTWTLRVATTGNRTTGLRSFTVT